MTIHFPSSLFLSKEEKVVTEVNEQKLRQKFQDFKNAMLKLRQDGPGYGVSYLLTINNSCESWFMYFKKFLWQLDILSLSENI